MDAPLLFEWDSEKAETNLRKHKVSFELARRVWNDPLYEVTPDPTATNEERWIAMGVVGSKTLLVVHTYPDPNDDQAIRIISAREATRQEKRRYGEGDV